MAAIYADGGCIRKNPSPIGGMWAWCLVNELGERVSQGSGVMVPAYGYDAHFPDLRVDRWPFDEITNNQMEFVALVLGLEALPDGWSGAVCSDSQVTLGRFFKQWKLDGIPPKWIQRGGFARRRLGQLSAVLLDGHPTRRHLADGKGKRGNRVSQHNVWCDEECNRVARRYLELLQAQPFGGQVMVCHR
ncbi:MAG: hypothetical protein KGJ86_18865 [Chloroflexota bacterium]|nr:hypothetical protein [Chloroflexota bacterium]